MILLLPNSYGENFIDSRRHRYQPRSVFLEATLFKTPSSLNFRCLYFPLYNFSTRYFHSSKLNISYTLIIKNRNGDWSIPSLDIKQGENTGLFSSTYTSELILCLLSPIPFRSIVYFPEILTRQVTDVFLTGFFNPIVVLWYALVAYQVSLV